MKKKMSDVKFEEAFKELEEISKKMNLGEINLDQRIELFKRGRKLYEHCNKKLENAKVEIEKITIQAKDSSTVEEK